MKISDARRFPPVWIVVAVLAGCSGTQASGGASAVLPPGATAATSHIRLGPSWMKSGVSNDDLLYISDGNGEVTVYRYWKRSLVGILTDATQPQGECVDTNNDVFVTDYAASRILEYAHGGTKPIAKLKDAPYRPYACSVDLGSGSLAVANVGAGSSGGGNVAVYAHASGTPAIYADPNISDFRGCAYDNAGNLLATNDYVDISHSFASFAWLPKGGSRLVDLRVPGPNPSFRWADLQGLQWDGKYFVVDDYTVYRVAVSNGQAYYIGYTSLDTFGGYAAGYWIYNNAPTKQGTQVVAAVREDSGTGAAFFWHYPSGGEPIDEVSHAISAPVAVAVSLKKHD